MMRSTSLRRSGLGIRTEASQERPPTLPGDWGLRWADGKADIGRRIAGIEACLGKLRATAAWPPRLTIFVPPADTTG